MKKNNNNLRSQDLSVTIPWTDLLSESCHFTISGLTVTLQVKPCYTIKSHFSLIYFLFSCDHLYSFGAPRAHHLFMSQQDTQSEKLIYWIVAGEEKSEPSTDFSLNLPLYVRKNRTQLKLQDIAVLMIHVDNRCDTYSIWQVWELLIILGCGRMYETRGCPGLKPFLIRHRSGSMGGVAGEPWQEAEQINQRRGGDGRSRAACPGHRLCHHAGSGWNTCDLINVHCSKKQICLFISFIDIQI